MSEQTANLCTTDAAESLRAVVAERDREIERLKEGQSILILARDEQKRLANEYRDLWSRADLKAKPSGVVLPPMVEFDDMVNRLFELDDDARKYCCRHWLLTLWKATLDRVCQLNSSPVSAGGVDERAAFEAWYLGHFYMGDKQCGLEWLSTESCGGYRHQHPAEQWVVWQARAALSAPSHGGGVAHTDCRSEDGITVGLIDSIITSCRVLSSRDLTCEAAVEALRDLRSDSDVSLIKPSHGEQVQSCATCNGVGIVGHSTLCPECAAAPSAGSQGGDV